jgi:hypothetical protein
MFLNLFLVSSNLSSIPNDIALFDLDWGAVNAFESAPMIYDLYTIYKPELNVAQISSNQ